MPTPTKAELVAQHEADLAALQAELDEAKAKTVRAETQKAECVDRWSSCDAEAAVVDAAVKAIDTHLTPKPDLHRYGGALDSLPPGVAEVRRVLLYLSDRYGAGLTVAPAPALVVEVDPAEISDAVRQRLDDYVIDARLGRC